MYDSSFSAIALKNPSTYADNFTVWLFTEDTTGVLGLLTLCISEKNLGVLDCAGLKSLATSSNPPSSITVSTH